jgi:hypothetical protein
MTIPPRKPKIEENNGIYYLVDDIERGRSLVDMWS